MTKFDYIDSLDKITGNEIEIWASELDKEPKRYFNEELATIMMKLTLLESVGDTEINKATNGGDFLSTIINKRIAAFHTYTISTAAILFLATLSESPGIAVEYLNYLQYISHTKNINHITMETIGMDIFPMGVFDKSTLEKYWDAQKVKLSPDNLLDYFNAGTTLKGDHR